MKTMSRDARKILDNLSKLTGRGYAASDVFVAESLCITYFPNIVNNIVKQIYKKSTSEDRVHLWYYVKPIASMAKQKRSDDVWEMSPDEAEVYTMVTGRYLIEDFNNDQLVQLRTICSHSHADVSEAISIGKSEDVYSVPYILRILEGIDARRQMRLRQMDDRRGMVVSGVDGAVVRRGPADVASLSYGWLQTIENVELKSRVDRLYEGDTHSGGN